MFGILTLEFMVTSPDVRHWCTISTALHTLCDTLGRVCSSGQEARLTWAGESWLQMVGERLSDKGFECCEAVPQFFYR